MTLMTLLCCCCAWGFLGILCWYLYGALRQGLPHLQALHQIPCDRCQYCTGHPVLKCAVHPLAALSVEAIDCSDFVADSKTT
jgi:hypothetical protein